MDELEPEVGMFCDIARHFEDRPADDAAATIAAHLTKFWDPQMRRILIMAVAEGTMVDPVTSRVAAMLALGLLPP
mgnify:CR=1 FL=1